MAQHKRRVVFTLAVLLLSPPFFLEQPPRLRVTTSHSESPPLSNSLFQHQRQDIQWLLLTPTFIVHLFWIVGFLLLSLIALFDVILKLVYVACTLGVNSVAPHLLQPTVLSMCHGRAGLITRVRLALTACIFLTDRKRLAYSYMVLFCE